MVTVVVATNSVIVTAGGVAVAVTVFVVTVVKGTVVVLIFPWTVFVMVVVLVWIRSWMRTEQAEEICAGL